MTTIVMNTMNGAVTEHALSFQSLSANHGAGDDGLFTLGGHLDDTLPIAARATTGKLLWGDSAKALLSDAYLSMTGTGHGDFTVHGKALQWPYRFTVLPAGVSRVPLGRGIKENYLAFTYANVGGADFTIDRIEIRTFNAQRRI